MSDILLVPKQEPSYLMVPVEGVQADLVTKTGTIIYVPLASTTSPGIVQVGEGLLISGSGLLSLDQTEIPIKSISKNGTLIVPDAQKNVNIELSKSDVGLGNVDNTSDLNKPISSAQQSALNAKVDKYQGTENIDKVLTVGSDGYLYLSSIIGGGVSTYQNGDVILEKTESYDFSNNFELTIDNRKVSIDLAESVLSTINNKVDKISGKGLSTEDYTTEEKTKLEGIATGAEVNVLETIKVNNTALTPINKTVNIDLSSYALISETGNKIVLELDSTNYKITAKLKDKNDVVISTSAAIDLPLESVVVNGSYDSTNQKIVLTLQNGNTINVPVGALISGLQSEITSSNKLDADLVDDTNSTHKFVLATDKTAWNAKYSKPLTGIPATDLEESYYLASNPSGYTKVESSNTNGKIKVDGTDVTVYTLPNDVARTSDLPTKVSDLQNDSGFITGYTETDPTVPSWAKASTKPTYDYSEITNTPTLPTVNDSTIIITQGGVEKGRFTLNQASGDTITLDAGGGGSSTDVQVDSTSITSGGVADIKTISGDYNASTNKLATQKNIPLYNANEYKAFTFYEYFSDYSPVPDTQHDGLTAIPKFSLSKFTDLAVGDKILIFCKWYCTDSTTSLHYTYVDNRVLTATISGTIGSGGSFSLTNVGELSISGLVSVMESRKLAYRTEVDAKQDALDATQLAAVNSGADSTKIGQITANENAISGLQTSKQDVIDATHKLSADLVNDTSSSNKFMSSNTIKDAFGVELSGSGELKAKIKTGTDYTNMLNDAFIGKGTLEGVLASIGGYLIDSSYFDPLTSAAGSRTMNYIKTKKIIGGRSLIIVWGTTPDTDANGFLTGASSGNGWVPTSSEGVKANLFTSIANYRVVAMPYGGTQYSYGWRVINYMRDGYGGFNIRYGNSTSGIAFTYIMIGTEA